MRRRTRRRTPPARYDTKTMMCLMSFCNTGLYNNVKWIEKKTFPPTTYEYLVDIIEQ